MLIKFDCGPTKLQVIKMVKEFMGIDLKEAKDACDLGSIEVEGRYVEDFIRQLRTVGGEVLNCGSQVKKDTNPPCAPQYPLVKIGETYKLSNNTTFVITEVSSVMRNSIVEFKYIGEVIH